MPCFATMELHIPENGRRHVVNRKRFVVVQTRDDVKANGRITVVCQLRDVKRLFTCQHGCSEDSDKGPCKVSQALRLLK